MNNWTRPARSRRGTKRPYCSNCPFCITNSLCYFSPLPCSPLDFGYSEANRGSPNNLKLVHRWLPKSLSKDLTRGNTERNHCNVPAKVEPLKVEFFRFVNSPKRDTMKCFPSLVEASLNSTQAKVNFIDCDVSQTPFHGQRIVGYRRRVGFCSLGHVCCFSKLITLFQKRQKVASFLSNKFKKFVAKRETPA